MPVGARLAEMARIRLQYDETRQQVQDIQQVFYHHFHEIFFFHFFLKFSCYFSCFPTIRNWKVVDLKDYTKYLKYLFRFDIWLLFLFFQSLASLEEKINPGQLESDKDRLLLINEKEHLLRELRSISSRTRSIPELEKLKAQCFKLEQDLNEAQEMSNRCIAGKSNY